MSRFIYEDPKAMKIKTAIVFSAAMLKKMLEAN
jgi:hypothetical protein